MKYEISKIVKETKEVEILDCPFCGSDNLTPVHIQGEYGYSSSEDYVKCLQCGATGGLIKDSNCGNNTELAIKRWNIRV